MIWRQHSHHCLHALENPALEPLIEMTGRNLLIVLGAVFGGGWLLLPIWKSGRADRE